MLQCACDLHVELLEVLVVLLLRATELSGPGDLSDLRFFEPNHDVLRFEIGMDDIAHAVHIIEADQTLPSELPCQRHWHTLIVVSLDDFEEVHA